MKTYKVTIYPVVPWTVRVEAKNEEEAKKKALLLDGPEMFAFQINPELEEWVPQIWEWPNIGPKDTVDIEEEEY